MPWLTSRICLQQRGSYKDCPRVDVRIHPPGLISLLALEKGNEFALLFLKTDSSVSLSVACSSPAVSPSLGRSNRCSADTGLSMPTALFWRMSIGMRPIPPTPTGFSVIRLRYPGSSTTTGLLDTQCRLPGATPSRQSGMRLPVDRSRWFIHARSWDPAGILQRRGQ